jgi:hypothetical protein
MADEAADIGESRPLRNGISLGGAYVFQLERERESQETGQPLRTRQSLGGFVIRYQREIIPERFAIGFAKPFYFARDRFDSPFELSFKGILRRGSWEAFFAGVITWNLRVFERERAAQEGERNQMSLGIGAVVGGGYWFTRQWGLELEVAYEYIPTDDIVEHEIATALNGAYRF